MFLTIIFGAIIFLLLFGFLLGFARNWCKSIVRLSIVIVDLVVSLLFSPLIASVLVNKYISGSVLSIFDYTIDFSDVAVEMLGDNIGDDLSLISDEINVLARAIGQVVLNLIIFLIMFLLILIVTLIIYWIVLIILRFVAKKEKQESVTFASTIGLRFVGAFEGLLTMLIIVFAFLVPIFGVVDVCNKFIDDNSSSNEQVASAVSTENLICGELYYTESDDTESEFGSYGEFIESYNSSALGKFFNFTHISNLGSTLFNYLSKVTVDDETIKLSDEIVVFAEIYSIYSDEFLGKSFDLTDNDSLDAIIQIVDKLNSSVLGSSFAEDLLPTVAERLQSGGKFLGISVSVDENYAQVVDDLLEIFKSTKSMSRINFNVKTIIEAIKIINEHSFVEKVNESGLIEALESDNTIISEVIVKLSATNEIQNNLPIILNDSVALLYTTVLNETMSVSYKESYTILSWEDEANTIQNIISTFLEVYSSINNAEDADAMAVNELGNIGKAIDYSRQSSILSDSLKEFIEGYINSDLVSFGDDSDEVKATLITYINEHWDLSENSDYSFEENFNILSETIIFATKISDGEDVSMSEIETMLSSIISNENLKAQTLEILQNSNLVYGFIGQSYTATVVIDIIGSYISGSDINSLGLDLDAGQVIIDLITTEEFSSDLSEIETMLLTVTSSNVVMEYIDSNVGGESYSNLQLLVQSNIGSNKIAIVNEVIENSQNIDDNDKVILYNLFN